MSWNPQSSRILSPKSLVSLLGAEYCLMRSAGVLRRFYTSALLIVTILLLTGVSIFYALDLLFHNLTIEIILAVFFSLLFLCIYIFLLNTFAKENRAQKGIFNISNIIRIGFVAFMGILIAQPLVILLYASTLSSSIENYKQKVWSDHTAKIDGLMNKEMATLVNKQRFYTTQKKQFGTTVYNDELLKIEDRINALHHKAILLKQAAQQAINYNNFFLFRIEKVNRQYRLSWFLTLVIVLLFLMPGYLVYSISSQHEYYQLKKAQEKELITAAYGVFARRYQTMFAGQVTIFSRYENPPFNTVRKQPPVPASMTDFMQKYIDSD